MQPHYQAIRDAGAELLCITMTQPAFLTEYLKQRPRPFPLLSDPDLASYKVFGLERASIGSFFRWRVLQGYLRFIARGLIPRKPIKGEDVRQLGGEFVLDGQRRLVYAFRSDDPTEHPRIEDVMDALRK